jgi:protein-tyrosine sulfotransferase
LTLVPGQSRDDPVFVLCTGRSGSTLLRFLLDAHPELACPPETELAAMCSRVATVWQLFERQAPGQQAGAAGIPGPVIAGRRHTVDLMVGPYLARRGKQRLCDKSLGSARHADLLARTYPRGSWPLLAAQPFIAAHICARGSR